MALDSSGNPVERYHYSPYGEVTFLNADFTTRSDSSIENEHLYTGRRTDPVTGLQLNRHRYYHAKLGRWVTRDPVRRSDLEEGAAFSTGGQHHISFGNATELDFAFLLHDPTLDGQYADGLNLYAAYFVPNGQDPSGLKLDCPEKDRKPRPGAGPPTTNGCTSVPDYWYFEYGQLMVPVIKACNRHDLCYQGCGSTQYGCDIAFYREMIGLCHKHIPWQMIRARAQCRIKATIYYWGVRTFGGDPFDDAQENQCDCPCE